ncbi:restriction endonuclease subunit S [Kocuria carniphila]|uniref:restriction endonuclease subunit S n=1 Tax=Kocuria carniphila TaxID=262208 RepID=UPI00101BCECE|nr:restriction endonuclease subunit S [Kocuria carniphila]
MIQPREARLFNVSDVRVSTVDKHTNEGEQAVRLCNYVDVYKNEVILNDFDFMPATCTPDEIARFRLAPGDVVFTKDSETADDIGIPAFVETSAPDLVCGYHVAIATPHQDLVDPKFLFWYLNSRPAFAWWETRASGVTRVGLRQEDIRHLPLGALPPMSHQRAIADFLDRETAQIDAMIEAQEQLLRSVMERRAAIRRRGFFDLRETEATRPLKHLTVKVSGSAFPLDEQGEQGLELPFHKVAALAHRDSRGVITAESDSITSETSSELGAQIVPAGSSLMAKIGAASLLARVGINMHDCCIDNNMVAFVPRTGVVSRFLYHVLCDLDIYPYINQSTIPYMNERAIMNAPVPLPTLAEQQRLVEGFDKELAQGSILVGETETSIAVLRERREALITAAVTGRIDPATGVERIDPTTEKEAS